MANNPHPNQCVCRNRNKGREWATDGSGLRPVTTVAGRQYHDECLGALSDFVAAALGTSDNDSDV